MPASQIGIWVPGFAASGALSGLLGVGFFVVVEEGDDTGCGDHCEEGGGDHEVMHGIAPGVVGSAAIPTNPESQSCVNS